MAFRASLSVWSGQNGMSCKGDSVHRGKACSLTSCGSTSSGSAADRRPIPWPASLGLPSGLRELANPRLFGLEALPLVQALAIRSEKDFLLTLGWFSNAPLLGAVLLTLGLPMAVIDLEPLQPIFKATGLSLEELAVALSLPWVVLIAVEVEKWLVRQGLIHRG